MQTIIQKQLQQIEQQHNIQIIYACESGSRAWGFASPNSDYDVRFIYMHPMEKYLAIEPIKNQLTFPITSELDIHGWDLKKTLQLIHKSNATPFEWLQSPIIYQQQTDLAQQLWRLCAHYFNPRGNVHHYLGIASSALQNLSGRQIKIKQLFYILRPLLSACWCIQHKQIAPMTITPLLQLLQADLHKHILELIDFKNTVIESHIIEISSNLHDYITTTTNHIKSQIPQLPELNFTTTQLDTFFINTLKNHVSHKHH